MYAQIFRRTHALQSAYTQFCKENAKQLGMSGCGPAWAKLTAAERREYAIRELDNKPIFTSAEKLYESVFGSGSWSGLATEKKQEWSDRAAKLAQKFAAAVPKAVSTKSAFKKLAVGTREQLADDWSGADKKYWKEVASELTVEKELAHDAFLKYADEQQTSDREQIKAGWRKLRKTEKQKYVQAAASDSGKPIPPPKKRGRVSTLSSAGGVSSAAPTKGFRSSAAAASKRPAAKRKPSTKKASTASAGKNQAQKLSRPAKVQQAV